MVEIAEREGGSRMLKGKGVLSLFKSWSDLKFMIELKRMVEKSWLLGRYVYCRYRYGISNFLELVAICTGQCRTSFLQPQLCVLLVLDMYFSRDFKRLRIHYGWFNHSG